MSKPLNIPLLLEAGLNPKEIALLLALRNKFGFGDVTIVMKDYVPLRLRKAYEFDNLEATEFDSLG